MALGKATVMKVGWTSKASFVPSFASILAKYAFPLSHREADYVAVTVHAGAHRIARVEESGMQPPSPTKSVQSIQLFIPVECPW